LRRNPQFFCRWRSGWGGVRFAVPLGHMTSALGTIVSLADAIELCVPVANRRREVRRKPSDVRWLRGARLKYGPQVVVIDISASGILVRNDEELQANAPVVFEFSGTTGAVLVLARVLRSRRVVSGGLVEYEIACRFKRPVAFPGLVADVRRRENSKARLVHLNESPQATSAKTSASART
jgi:PilZ domain-containing protein